MVQIHSPQPILMKYPPIPLKNKFHLKKRISNEESEFQMKKMNFNTTKRNKKRQNQKNDKIFKKMTKKKKTLYAIILQIHSNSKCIPMQMHSDV